MLGNLVGLDCFSDFRGCEALPGLQQRKQPNEADGSGGLRSQGFFDGRSDIVVPALFVETVIKV